MSAKARKKSPRDAPEAEAPAPLPGLGTRDGGKLREAHVAFEAGDYARVRERCRDLEANAEDPEVRAAAADLRSRIEVDPLQVVVLLACAAVVVAIVMKWIL